MAKNQSKEFATMDDDERRRFAIEQEAETRDKGELSFGDPRDMDHAGTRGEGLQREGTHDPERRDGAAAELDDEAHREAVRRQAKGARSDRDGEGA
jgi:hypothetical protein